MQFPVTLLRDKGGGFTVTFPDIPEAISEGDTEAEALAHAHDALVSALDFYFEDRRPVPLPSPPKRRQKIDSRKPAPEARQVAVLVPPDLGINLRGVDGLAVLGRDVDFRVPEPRLPRPSGAHEVLRERHDLGVVHGEPGQRGAQRVP